MSHENCCEEFAHKIAIRVAGPQPSGDGPNEAGVGAGDFTALLDLIMQIVTTLIDRCPSNSDAKVVAAIRKPGFLVRGRFRSQVMAACSQCYTYRWREQSGNVAQAMLDEAAAATDAELLAVLFHAKNEDWLAI